MPSPSPGFEWRLVKLIGQRQQALRTDLEPIIERLLDPGTPLLPWTRVVEVLRELNVPEDEIENLSLSHQEAMRRRRSPKPPLPGSAAGQNDAPRAPQVSNGETRITPNPRTSPATPRPALEDADGHDQKPNPLDESARASTFIELDELLLKYWRWAGRPPSRQLAKRSDGAFSHTTVNKLTGPKGRDGTRPFSRRQEYVIGFIRACGGTKNDQMSWVSAWRKIACSEDDR